MTSTTNWDGIVTAFAVLIAAVACGSSATDPHATAGGAAGSSSGSGGVVAATGGSAGSSQTSSGGVGTGGTVAQGGASPSTGGTAGSAGASNSACDPASNALTTGNADWDRYDCRIIELSAHYGFPDARIIKSMAMQESSLDILATSQDSPCGIPNGWTDAESKSFGLLQVTPACGEGNAALLSDGHPNLAQDSGSAGWATSIFNPDLNLDAGVSAIAGGLDRLRQRYPGCTEVEYTLMAAGAYNSGVSAVLGCGSYNQRAQTYVNAVLGRYATFSSRGGWPQSPYPSSV